MSSNKSDAVNKTSDKEKATEQKQMQESAAVEAIEEDDEFEEFEPDRWDTHDEDAEDAQQWQDNWDDDDIEDDFTKSLRAELTKNAAAAETSS